MISPGLITTAIELYAFRRDPGRWWCTSLAPIVSAAATRCPSANPRGPADAADALGASGAPARCKWEKGRRVLGGSWGGLGGVLGAFFAAPNDSQTTTLIVHFS